MVMAVNRVRNVLSLGPLWVDWGSCCGEAVQVRVGGRGLEVALCLRDLGCNVDLVTAINSSTFVGRHALRRVGERGVGVRYVVHDGSVGDLGVCSGGSWGESLVLASSLDAVLGCGGWVVCDGSLGPGCLGMVERACAGNGVKAVYMGSGPGSVALLDGGIGWTGVCLDRGGWRGVGGYGVAGDYETLSSSLGRVPLRVEGGNGVCLTLRDGRVVDYGVWRGLAEETARLTLLLMDEVSR